MAGLAGPPTTALIYTIYENMLGYRKVTSRAHSQFTRLLIQAELQER